VDGPASSTPVAPAAQPAVQNNSAPPGTPLPVQPTIERPDFSVPVPRPAAPKSGADYKAVYLVIDNGVYHLRENVVIEFVNSTLKADLVDFDSNTGVATATGHIYYRNYLHDEVIYADRAEYDRDTEKGKFYGVRGYAKAKIVARPGVLTSKDPFYFEAEWAEKDEDKYILHDGFITDCEMPNPWWTLHSRRIDYIAHDHAIARNAVYRVRNMPIFFFPWFYKSLKTEPRKSGFLTPNIGHSSTRGFLFGLGYYQTLGRTMDTTYVIQDFTSRGYAHHVDFRGKPTQKTDFNLIFYGVQDRGIVQNGALIKAPGFSITGSGKTEFGHGWTARGSVDYLSSLLFHQQFTESFSEAIFSETHSSGYVEKHFGAYIFDTSVAREESFQDTTPGNVVIIRTLPELALEGHDQQLAAGPVPLWFSLRSSFGLFHRVQPNQEGQPLSGFYQTSQFSPRAVLEPSLSTAFRFGGFSVLPEVTAHEKFYGQTLVNNVVSGDNQLRSAPELSVDLVFPAIAKVFDKKTIFGDKLRHVIEPRVRYDLVTGVSDFLNTLRFDQTDVLSDTNEAEVGLANRIYAKRGDSVNEIFSWDLSQKFYFDPTFGGAVVPGQRNVLRSELEMTGYSFLDGRRKYSPIVSSLRASPINGFSFAWEGDFDPALHRVVNSMISANVRIRRYFVNAGSDQVRPNPVLSPPANQFRTTFGYGDPNRKGWNAAFSIVYDYRLALLEYGIGQINYNTSCCGISVQVRRLDFGSRVENQYLASFSIANLGSVGTLKKQERIF
jgi:LPS-assembly protein